MRWWNPRAVVDAMGRKKAVSTQVKKREEKRNSKLAEQRKQQQVASKGPQRSNPNTPTPTMTTCNQHVRFQYAPTTILEGNLGKVWLFRDKVSGPASSYFEVDWKTHSNENATADAPAKDPISKILIFLFFK